MKLTAGSIRAYRLPPGMAGQDIVDDALPGFHIRFRASGAHAYAVRYGPKGARRWHTIGPVSSFTLEQARAAAKEFQVALALGRDPAREKAAAKVAAMNTFGALVSPYVAMKRLSRRERTVDEVERYLRGHARPLHKLPVREIDRATVAALLAEVEKTHGPGARNNLRNYASGFFSWMIGEGLVDSNPVAVTRKAASKSRDRLLTDAEVKAILSAVGRGQRVDSDFGDIVRLLFLTGLRRDEIARLEWREVDLAEAAIIVSGARMKNHRDHLVPLSGAALAILEGRHDRLEPGDPRLTVFGRRDTGFSGFSKAKRELDAVVADANGGEGFAWALHDIRRYVSTVLNGRLGVEPHVVEAILGHSVKGVAGRYNLSDYADAKRRALDKLADQLQGIMTGEAAKARVVRLGKR
jgi:integrase